MYDEIIVLGSSGFIGKAICEKLKKKKKFYKGFSSKDLNLLDNNCVDKIKEIINDEDAIVFTSALAPCKDDISYSKNLCMANNFILGIDKIKPKHIIYISSDAVYEDSKNLIRENNPLDSSNIHARMHIEREKIFINHCNKKKINLTIARPTLVYGPGDTHNGYGPNKFIREVNNKKGIFLFGEGEEKRDHILINDLAFIISEFIDKKIYGIYTLATGEVISFYDIAKIIYNLKGLPLSNINYIKRTSPMPHNGYRAFDVSKIKSIIRNFNLTDIEEGIKKSINSLF